MSSFKPRVQCCAAPKLELCPTIAAYSCLNCGTLWPFETAVLATHGKSLILSPSR
jgi:hypothetical protein